MLMIRLHFSSVSFSFTSTSGLDFRALGNVGNPQIRMESRRQSLELLPKSIDLALHNAKGPKWRELVALGAFGPLLHLPTSFVLILHLVEDVLPHSR